MIPPLMKPLAARMLAPSLTFSLVLSFTLLAGCQPTRTGDPATQPAAVAPTEPGRPAPRVATPTRGAATAPQSSTAPAARPAAPRAAAAPAPSGDRDPYAVVVDPRLPEYQPRTRVRGRLTSIGSDTMDNVMQLWEAEFTRIHPGIRVFHEGKGSSTAVPNLAEGLSNFGPMSRPLKDSEVEMFRQKFGYAPIQLATAIDSLAVYVHADNPIARRGLSLAELDAIYSSTRLRKHPRDIETWGDLGLTGEWADQPINVYSRDTASGTYGFFKDEVLLGGDYKADNAELIDSRSVVDAVEDDRYGIGYSGIGYRTDGVALVPLSRTDTGRKYAPQPINAYSGRYPLARLLYLAVRYNEEWDAELSDLQKEFFRYIYSRQGQRAVIEDGFFPISALLARRQLERIGIEPGF